MHHLRVLTAHGFGWDADILYASLWFPPPGSGSVTLCVWVTTSCRSGVPLWLDFCYTYFFLDFSWKLLCDFFFYFLNQQPSFMLLLCVPSGRHKIDRHSLKNCQIKTNANPPVPLSKSQGTAKDQHMYPQRDTGLEETRERSNGYR